jgi:DNA-binding XRE family transcriptional regulator
VIQKAQWECEVTPEEIKQLRKDLGWSARQLAVALGVDQSTVLSWEKSELFPTKAFVSRMTVLRAHGRRAEARPAGGEAMKALAEPKLWELMRKLAAHPALLVEVVKLAERYPDPAER